jgi:hypothetical protein
MLYSVIFLILFVVEFCSGKFHIPSTGDHYSKMKQKMIAATKNHIRSEVAHIQALEELKAEMVHEEAGSTGSFVQMVIYREASCKNIDSITFFRYGVCTRSAESGLYTILTVSASATGYNVVQNFYSDSMCMTQIHTETFGGSVGCMDGESYSFANKVPRKFAKRPGFWVSSYANQNQCPGNILTDANTASYYLFNLCYTDGGNDFMFKSCTGPTDSRVTGMLFSSTDGSCTGTTTTFSLDNSDEYTCNEVDTTEGPYGGYLNFRCKLRFQ